MEGLIAHFPLESEAMANVYLLTNDGSGEDGDEWLLDSIHATRESAEAAKTEWYRSVEEWEIEGSLLTDAEREAIGNVLHHIATRADHLQREAHDLRGLLERCAIGSGKRDES